MPAINTAALDRLSNGIIHLELEQPRIGVMLGILIISLFGVSKQVRFLRIPHLVFFIGKHFGTGAILSTAFCHLLPDAFDSLQNPDVEEKYHGIGKWTGLIILVSLLSIFLVEYASTSYVDHLHAEPSAPPSPSYSPPPSRSKTPQASLSDGTVQPILPPQSSSSPPINPRSYPNCTTFAATESTPLIGAPKRTKSLCNFDHHRDDALLSLILLNSPRLSRGGLPHSGLVWGRDVACVCHMGRVALAQACENDAAFNEGEEDEEKDVKPKIGRRRQVIGILILQLGIMIHSLVIGLTLAITTGTDFTSLVTAIVFHQLFEGLSLGIRIAGLPLAQFPSHDPPTPSRSSSSSSNQSFPSQAHSHSHHESWTSRWLSPTLSILFAITTPLGILAGTYLFAPSKPETDPDQAARMHLTQGLMSGISAGMLIYAATVEMLAGDFVFGDVGGDHGHAHEHTSHGHVHDHDHAHEESRLTPIWRKVIAVCSLLAGVTAMALVGLGE
ncbi:hypothetical protein D9615_008224 [Tricholomella constricta]|uniref:Zinc/iron permease n=1 Tax=Tricholomella constricta TaxID=117010 RepID=A0A8H5H396_9AGAR|nr:hypothetical protein D9615_008224 [Tricholomella constricta]